MDLMGWSACDIKLSNVKHLSFYDSAKYLFQKGLLLVVEI